MKKKYVEISPEEKLALLKEHAIGAEWQSLDDRKWCLHCESEFTGHSVRVYRDNDPGVCWNAAHQIATGPRWIGQITRGGTKTIRRQRLATGLTKPQDLEIQSRTELHF